LEADLIWEDEMTISLNGTQYYRTHEACQLAGITKNTYLRWVAGGWFKDVECRDRRGWRLFTQADLERLISEANRVQFGQDSPTKASLPGNT
jgi:hypothetical protein